MTFVQPAFVVLFGIVFTLYWLAPKKSWQNLVLCVSSAIFYGWVHPWFLGLLAFSAVQPAPAPHPHHRSGQHPDHHGAQ